MMEIMISIPGELAVKNVQYPNAAEYYCLLPYETETVSGVMLAMGGRASVPPAAVPLECRGRYKIYIALFSGFYQMPEVRIKLDHEQSFQKLSLRRTNHEEFYDSAVSIYEVFWKEADLNGNSLVFDGSLLSGELPSAIAYIRLEEIEDKQFLPKTRIPVAITADGWGAFGYCPHQKSEDLLVNFEQIPRDLNIKLLFWGNGVGDWCNYPTKIGNYFSKYTSPIDIRADDMNILQRNAQIWQKQSWDSMAIVREYARQRGWEFHVYIRMQGFGVLYPKGMLVQSDFFAAHPEYYCRDKQGVPVCKLSYAYPAVQEHMLALIEEILTYQPDGICLNFTRGLPMVLYEDVLVEQYQALYHEDPRQLPEDEPRWLALQKDTVTAFIQKVKKVLNGRRLSVMVPGNPQDAEKYALDIPRWVKDGYIDDLVVAGTRYNVHDVHVDDPTALDFDAYASLEGRGKIRLMPLLYPWGFAENRLGDWLRIYKHAAENGADFLGFWDAEINPPLRLPKLEILNDIERFEKENPLIYRKIPLKTFQGFRADRYHYFEQI